MPNVVLISIDTLRADHLGSYGYARATSPTIDALARSSHLFEQAFSQSPKTAISHMSIFTGLLPEAHGVGQLGDPNGRRISDEIETLTGLLARAGYETFGVTGGAHVSGALGFDRDMKRFTSAQHVTQVVDKALDFLEPQLSGKRDAPFFLFLHTYSVHDPYWPPEPHRSLFLDPGYSGRIRSSSDPRPDSWWLQHERFWSLVDTTSPIDRQHLIDLYDGSIHWVDAELGRLLERLQASGILDDSVLVLLSDHGEEFQEHGRYLHDQVFQETLHVPFLLRLPVDPAIQSGPRRHAQIVKLVDLLPTLVDLLGLPPPPRMDGRSLVPLMRGQELSGTDVLSAWPRHGAHALRRGDWKLVIQPGRLGITETMLFNLREDPLERRDRADQEPETLYELIDAYELAKEQGRHWRRQRAPGAKIVTGEEVRNRLKALGYVH